MKITAEITDRFLSKFHIKNNKCWEWTDSLNEHGYGRLKVNGKMMKAHRISYMIYIGKIPKGKVIDHVCRNRKCVNPLHLEAVSNKENQRRRRKELL